jgi:hypothetical protein
MSRRGGFSLVRVCVICESRFCRVDPTFRPGRFARLFCSPCIDAIGHGEVPCR